MEILTPEEEMILAAVDGQFRRMKRVEYEKLGTEGFFDDEKVELLFGMVVPMSPVDPAHPEAIDRIADRLRDQLGTRARVRTQSSFPATDDSEPEPDVFVFPPGTYWKEHPSHALLVVEVARSSLRRDRVKRIIYARANVDEYWIVNHIDGCVEVYRDRTGRGNKLEWRHISIHRRGETISPLAFPDVQIAVSDILPPLES